ncbi:unnamed protein product [Calypogeia fissa]
MANSSVFVVTTLRLVQLTLVFGLTLIQFFVFWNREPPIDGRPFLPRRTNYTEVEGLTMEDRDHETAIIKPWPNLPSFQPWNLDPDLQPYACEGFFGHGFTEEHRIIESRCKDEDGRTNSSRWSGESDVCGSFRCFFSETLKTSVCEGKNILMNPERIKVSRGGEALDEVIGRQEEEELPEYGEGAFQVQLSRHWHPKLLSSAGVIDEISVDKLMPKGQINQHTLRSLLLNLRSVDSSSIVCSERVHEPTLFVTRYEYANLFHTSTDWFSAYISSRVTGLQHRPHVVFLDGHCKSPMDDAWKAMFSSVTFAKHYSGSVCFDHAIFAPLGYDVPLFKYIDHRLNCPGSSVENLDRKEGLGGVERKMARLREFGEFVARSFETLPGERTSIVDHAQDIRVLFVRREDYLAHPRHNGKPESRLSNEGEVYETLKQWAVEKSVKGLNITIVNGLLAHMSMDEQVQAVKKADVLIGAHGAGMTYLMLAKPSTIVFELLSPKYRRPHFATLSYWMGMDYRVLDMESSFADIDQVMNEMDRILEDVKSRKYVM